MDFKDKLLLFKQKCIAYGLARSDHLVLYDEYMKLSSELYDLFVDLCVTANT